MNKTKNIYQNKPLKERLGASPASASSGPAKADDMDLSKSKRNSACRGEKTAYGSWESVSK